MIDTAYLERCIDALNKAHSLLLQAETGSLDYDIYRSACVKEFEIVLEQSGKLLKKAIKPYFHSNREADKLPFKDIFRHAALRSLLTPEAVERWLQYRDNRNSTAHDYGINFTEETLLFLPQFITDAAALAQVIKQKSNDTER